jgi:23S rRNA G2069 N7-methylase RlmK/C1962 C5-methylase RlmI
MSLREGSLVGVKPSAITIKTETNKTSENNSNRLLSVSTNSPIIFTMVQVLRLAMALLLWSLSRRTAQGFSIRSSTIPLRQTLVAFATKAPEDTSTASSSSLLADLPVVLLKRNRQSKNFRNGNQLVFKRAVDKGTAPNSALVAVAVQGTADQPPLPIGYGVFNGESLYKVRILCHRYLQPALYHKITNSENRLDADYALMEIVQHHLEMALRKREALHLPTPHRTSMYRLVNGEGDGLSGLQIDVINANTLVVQSSAAWCQVHKEIILTALKQVMPDCTNVIWKVASSRLKQDGLKGWAHQEESPEDPTPVVAWENGVQFQTFPGLSGQKTGVYCDQRENRFTLASYTQDKTVLDLCCYHGGFSLTALKQGGAASAVGVDSSAAAIEVAQQNAQLNDCADQAKFVRADIGPFLQQAAQDGQSFDVVVLDPPKLAPTVATLEKARRKYHGFNRDAIRLVSPQKGGLFLTCTCSAAMTQEEGGQCFLNMVAGAAQSAGREVTLLSRAGAASCHTQSPVSWPASSYLTAALFYVHPVE